VRNLLMAVAAATSIGFSGVAQSADEKKLAFVANGVSEFWRPAEAGVRKAQSELQAYTLLFKYPEESSAAAQARLLEQLVAEGVAGIVVSPVDATGMVETLNNIAGKVALFTTDSDAPNSKRLAYFGSSNTQAGRQAGQVLLKALPDGGKCMGFVGLPAADNARERIEGVRAAIKGSKVELVDVLADGFDRTRARRNVEETLAGRSDIDCMVGFYGYNTPQIYEALKQAGKVGKITIVGFDEEAITLGGVKEGTIAGTIVQQPFEWGYLSMTAMAKHLEGDKSILPPNRLVVLPTRVIERSNVDAFWTELKAVLCCMPTFTPRTGR